MEQLRSLPDIVQEQLRAAKMAPSPTFRDMVQEQLRAAKMAPSPTFRDMVQEQLRAVKMAPSPTFRDMVQEQLRAVKMAPSPTFRDMVQEQLRGAKLVQEQLREASYLSRLSPALAEQLRGAKLVQEELRGVKDKLREASYLSRLSPALAEQLRGAKLVQEELRGVKDKLREASYLSRLSPALAEQLRGMTAPEKSLRDVMDSQVHSLREARRQVELERGVALESASHLATALDSEPTTRELLFAVWDGDEYLPEREFLQSELDKQEGFEQLDVGEQIARLQQIVVANGSPRLSTYCVAIVINWLSQCFAIQDQVLLLFVTSLVFAWDFCTARQRVAQARKLCEAGGIESHHKRIVSRDTEVFDSPGHKRKRMRTVEAGMIVEVADNMGGWRQVIFFEDEVGHLRVGWVRSKYLRRVQ